MLICVIGFMAYSYVKTYQAVTLIMYSLFYVNYISVKLFKKAIEQYRKETTESMEQSKNHHNTFIERKRNHTKLRTESIQMRNEFLISSKAF